MSIRIDNQTPFALKIYRTWEDGSEKFSNLLGGHQTFVQEANINDSFSIRLLLDDRDEVKAISASEAHHDITISHADLRSNVRKQVPGDVGIPENILCDLYLVQEDGQWELEYERINPNHAGDFSGILPGQLLAGTVPNHKDNVLFWVYVYNPNEQDEGAEDTDEDEEGHYYDSYIIRNFLRGTVSSNQIHDFDDGKVTQERLLPSGRPQLFEGEVLVYQAPKQGQDYFGSGNYFWIFNTDIADISVYAPPVMSNREWILPPITAHSFIPGPNTSVTVYSQVGYGLSGTYEQSDQKVDDLPINSLKIELETSAAQVGLRLLTDLSEDTDASGADVTRFRTTLLFNKPRWHGGKLVWPRVRFQAQEKCGAFINRGAVETTLDPQHWTHWIDPNNHGRVEVSQKPMDEKLHTPALFIQTDEMDEHHVVAFHPSLALHQRLQDKFTDGSGNIADPKNREKLGIETDRDKLPDDACKAVQDAALNLSRMAVPNYSQDSSAIHARHQVNGSNMEHRHWHFSSDTDGHPRYKSLTKQEHAAKIDEIESQFDEGIEDLDQQVEESIFDVFEDAADSAFHIVVSVVDEIEHEVEAVVHFVKEGFEKAVRFTVKSVDAIGALIKKVFDAIVLLVKEIIAFIKFLLSLFGKIIEVYQQIKEAIRGHTAAWRDYIEHRLDEETVVKAIHSLEDFALQPFTQETGAHSQPGSSPLQWAVEKLTWLWHLIADFLQTIESEAGIGTPDGFVLELEETIVQTVTTAVLEAESTLRAFAENPMDANSELEEFTGNIVRDVFDSVEQLAGTGVAFAVEQVHTLDLEKGSWNVPLVGFLLDKVLDGITPLDIGCVVAAVPLGIMLAKEDQPVDLTLDFSSNISDAQKYLQGIGDLINVLNSPYKTMKLSNPNEIKSTAMTKFTYILDLIQKLSVTGTAVVGAVADEFVFGAAALIWELYSHTQDQAVDEKTALKVDVTADIVLAVYNLSKMIDKREADPKVISATAFESLGSILEFVGFFQGSPIEEYSMPAQGLLFTTAAGLRFAS